MQFRAMKIVDRRLVIEVLKKTLGPLRGAFARNGDISFIDQQSSGSLSEKFVIGTISPFQFQTFLIVTQKTAGQ